MTKPFAPEPLKFQEIADTQVLQRLDRLNTRIDAFIQELRNNHVEIPDVMDVEGNVRVTTLPDVRISNLSDLQSMFGRLETQIAHLSGVLPSLIPPASPPLDMDLLSRSFGKHFASLEQSIIRSGGSGGGGGYDTPVIDFPTDLSDSLRNMENTLHKLYEFESNRLTLTPPPVTNMNINALNGAFLSTPITVLTTPTALPTTALADRRGLVVYNNDASKVLYLGNSTVSVATGMLVPPSSYSPTFDAGSLMTLYGVSAAGTIDARTLEMSQNHKGN